MFRSNAVGARKCPFLARPPSRQQTLRPCCQQNVSYIAIAKSVAAVCGSRTRCVCLSAHAKMSAAPNSHFFKKVRICKFAERAAHHQPTTFLTSQADRPHPHIYRSLGVGCGDSGELRVAVVTQEHYEDVCEAEERGAVICAGWTFGSRAARKASASRA